MVRNWGGEHKECENNKGKYIIHENIVIENYLNDNMKSKVANRFINQFYFARFLYNKTADLGM